MFHFWLTQFTSIIYYNKYVHFYVLKNILSMLLYDIPYIILSYFSYSNLYFMLL